MCRNPGVHLEPISAVDKFSKVFSAALAALSVGGQRNQCRVLYVPVHEGSLIKQIYFFGHGGFG